MPLIKGAWLIFIWLMKIGYGMNWDKVLIYGLAISISVLAWMLRSFKLKGLMLCYINSLKFVPVG